MDEHLTIRNLFNACGRQLSSSTLTFAFVKGNSCGCFVIPLNSKIEQTAKSCVFMWIDPGSHTHWSQFQGTQPDHVRVEASSCYSPKWILSMTQDTFLFNIGQFIWILINNDLDMHIQAKTNDRRVRRFGDILAPLSRETKLKMRLRE